MRKWFALVALLLALAAPSAAFAQTVGAVHKSSPGSTSALVNRSSTGTSAKFTHDGVSAGGGIF